MKKIISFLFLSCFLTACVGNPPAWWNPSQSYTTQTQKAASSAKTPVQSQRVTVTPVNMEAEELISVPDEGYEEMPLTPIQDEEQEDASGESSAQVIESDEETDVSMPSVLTD